MLGGRCWVGAAGGGAGGHNCGDGKALVVGMRVHGGDLAIAELCPSVCGVDVSVVMMMCPWWCHIHDIDMSMVVPHPCWCHIHDIDMSTVIPCWCHVHNAHSGAPTLRQWQSHGSAVSITVPCP